jgi:DNA-binding CsgD family transcriptional regulator
MNNMNSNTPSIGSQIEAAHVELLNSELEKSLRRLLAVAQPAIEELEKNLGRLFAAAQPAIDGLGRRLLRWLVVAWPVIEEQTILYPSLEVAVLERDKHSAEDRLKHSLVVAEYFLKDAPKMKRRLRPRRGALLGGVDDATERRLALQTAVAAMPDIHRARRIRVGKVWVKKDGKIDPGAVPTDALSLVEWMQWLRAEFFTSLTEVVKGRPRRRSGARDEQAPAWRPRDPAIGLARTPPPDELPLLRAAENELLRLLEGVASKRELDILRARLSGSCSSWADVARRLGLKPATVRVHVSRLKDKRLKPRAREVLRSLL